MSSFSAPVFYTSRRKGKRWSVSGKLYALCCLFLLLYFLLESVLEIRNYESNWCVIMAFIFLIAGQIVRFFEYEPLQGKLQNFIKINDDHLLIEETVYSFSDIRGFDFNVSDYYGESHRSSGYGGLYSQGVSNFISFTDSSEMAHKFYFQFYSEPHIDEFYESVIERLHDGILPYNPKYLKKIPTDFAGYGKYREYVGSLMRQKVIGCNEGLEIMGYDSSEEAASLRDQYCP